MKKILFLLMLVGVSCYGAGNTYVGSFIGNGGGLTNIPYNNLTGVRASTNTTIQQLSVSSGGNVLNDMTNGTSYYPGQIGYTYGGGASALWFGIAAGIGTNVWGYPGNFYGGISTFGNPYWTDIPQSWNYGGGANIQSSMTIAWGSGPTASRLTNAYPNGPSNPSAQPGLNIIDYNPFNGAGGILIRGAYTNSARGQLAGTNADGVKIYVPQFGMQQLNIGDAYPPGESQQSPSYNFLFNDSQVGIYWSINGTRPGDSVLGQIPLMVMDNRSDFIWGIPFQTANVWMVTNNLWKYSLVVDSTTGSVGITNGPLTLSNSSATLIGNGTSDNAYEFGKAFNGGAMFEVHGSVNLDLNPTGNDGIMVYGTHGANNYGVISKNTFFTGPVVATGREMHFYQSSASDLLGTSVGSQTLTSMGHFDSSGNFIEPNNLTVSGTSTFVQGGSTTGYVPTATGTGGTWTWQAQSGGGGITNFNGFSANNGAVSNTLIASNYFGSNMNVYGQASFTGTNTVFGIAVPTATEQLMQFGGTSSLGNYHLFYNTANNSPYGALEFSTTVGAYVPWYGIFYGQFNTANGQIYSGNGLGITNIPSSSITGLTTNGLTTINVPFSVGSAFTNSTGYDILVSGVTAVFNPAAVAGRAALTVIVTNATITNYTVDFPTAIGLTITTASNAFPLFRVTNGGTFAFSDTSSGAGNSATIVGGQESYVQLITVSTSTNFAGNGAGLTNLQTNAVGSIWKYATITNSIGITNSTNAIFPFTNTAIAGTTLFQSANLNVGSDIFWHFTAPVSYTSSGNLCIVVWANQTILNSQAMAFTTSPAFHDLECQGHITVRATGTSGKLMSNGSEWIINALNQNIYTTNAAPVTLDMSTNVNIQVEAFFSTTGGTTQTLTPDTGIIQISY